MFNKLGTAASVEEIVKRRMMKWDVILHWFKSVDVFIADDV